MPGKSSPKNKPVTIKDVPDINTSIKLPGAHSKFSLSTRLCVFLAVLSFLVYANTLHNGYALDDDLFIAKNKYVNMGVNGIPELLTTAHMKGYSTLSNDTYRPLSLVMFAVENELFGTNPMTGHFINIILFIGCVILLFLFLDRLMDQKKTAVAFIAALVFAVHPVHTEVVANIKSRDELLCFFFAFWSVNSFLTYFDRGKNITLVVGASTLFLSLLAKETSISFILIIPLIFFFYRTQNKKRSIQITVTSLIAIAAFLSIRTTVLHEILPSGKDVFLSFIDNQLVKVPAGDSRLATAILGCGYYIKLLFVPYPLLCSYSFSTIPFASFSDIWVLLSLATYLFLAAFGVYRLVRFNNDSWAFGILFYLITIALFSNVLFLIPAIFAERFLFFASVGFCLLLALLVEKWGVGWKGLENIANDVSVLLKPKVLLFLATVVLVFGKMTVSRNSDWENDYILFKTDVENAPQNARLYCNLGVVLNANLHNEGLRPAVKSQMIEKGINYVRQAITIYPYYSNAYAELGQLYVRKKMFDSAEIHEKTAITLDTLNVHAIDILGAVYFNTNRFSEALALYLKVRKIAPDGIPEDRNIGLCYLYMHKYDSAVLNLRKALVVPSENARVLYEGIAISFREMGKTDSAKKYEQLMRR